MRILLVEDEQGLATVLKRGLEEQGYAVDLAGDGEEALAFAATEPYDLVVLDVMLPDVDGFTVCRQLRNDARNMPVPMVTALDSFEDRVAGLDSGADDYLAKPFDPRELLPESDPADKRADLSGRTLAVAVLKRQCPIKPRQPEPGCWASLCRRQARVG